MKKQYRYQLISPINGQKIYQTSSLKKATEKCYKELKDSGFTKSLKDNHFIVLNIDTNEPYTYKLKNKDTDINEEYIQKYIDPLQKGGEVDEEDIAKINVILAKKLDSMNSNITNIIEKMASLEEDLNILKHKEPIIYNNKEADKITIQPVIQQPNTPQAPPSPKPKEDIHVTCTAPSPQAPPEPHKKELDQNKCVIL